MYNLWDSNGPLIPSLYFIALIMMGSWIALNLILAQIFDTYAKELEITEKEQLSEEDD